MTENVSGPGPKEDPFSSKDTHYKAQYKISPEFQKFWKQLFKPAGYVPSMKEMSQMTDQFVKKVWDDCNQVLQWALQQQKDREQERKDNENS